MAIRSNVGSPVMIACPTAYSPHFMEMKVSTLPPRNLAEANPTQPYLVTAAKHTVQKLPDIKTTSSDNLKLNARIERWPIAGSFAISRGVKTEAVTVVATVSLGGMTGRGECVPYSRYGETPEATLAALKAAREPLRRGLTARGAARVDARWRRP